MGEIKVHTIKAMGGGLGYLVEIDGLKIFHAGLHVLGYVNARSLDSSPFWSQLSECRRHGTKPHSNQSSILKSKKIIRAATPLE